MIGALGGWGELIAAFAAFFASHILPARPPIRHWLRQRLGARAYMIGYSALSLVILGWLIVAAGRAPYIEIWPFALWQLWAPAIAMPIACFLIAFGVAAPNPFSIAGKNNERFDPERPGIAGITRHPLIWGLTLWALAHLIPNGNLAHLILFGLFAAFGLIGMAAIDRRRQREWGVGVWRKQARRTAFIPFAGLVSGRIRMAGFPALATRGFVAVALYVALLLSHSPVIGVSPWPVI